MAEPESADGHHGLTLAMMNTGPASGYRDSPHTAHGIPLSSNPTMTFAARERANGRLRVSNHPYECAA
jgi:hypothetical protein